MAKLLLPSQKIAPCLWFDNNAEEAVNFYCSVFRNAKIITETRYGNAGPGPRGSVMAIGFTLEGQEFMALNGGLVYTFTPAVSFFVTCDSQAEIDHFWEKLSECGEKSVCGWLKDKYGLSWQVAPTILLEMLQDRDPVKANRVMKAMLEMTKIDIAALERAYKGKE